VVCDSTEVWNVMFEVCKWLDVPVAHPGGVLGLKPPSPQKKLFLYYLNTNWFYKMMIFWLVDGRWDYNSCTTLF